LAQGIDTSAAGLALDVIAQVGPQGHFLTQKHTRQRVREIWIPELTHPRAAWGGEPLPDVRERARAKFDKILAEHEPEPLEEATQAELRAIMDAAERELSI
jgi:trimethylamine--corrinoid protein Co-methyltransferase